MESSHGVGIGVFMWVGYFLLLILLLWMMRDRKAKAAELAISQQRWQAEYDQRQRLEEELSTLSETLEQEVDLRTQQLKDVKDRLECEVQATERAKTRMTSIFESAPNGMLVVDKTGKITQANSMVASIFRCTPQDLVGKSVEQLVPQELRAQHHHDRDAFQQHPSKRMMGARRDLYGVRFDDTRVPLEVGLHPVDLDDGAEIVAAVVDISERKSYEQRIQERNKALEASNRELQEFAFIASHDLREPLRKIISFSKLLQEGGYGHLNQEGQEFSGYIVNAAERMRDLLSDLLAYSRVTSKANPLKDTRLNDLLEDVLEDLQLAVEECDADINVGELPTVAVDKVQIRQLFQNLIGNALKYHHNDRRPVINVFDQSDESVFRIIVKDNGIGFAQEYAEQIFEVFRRLHDMRTFPGTGMGLAICRKIVQRHGGQLYAKSVENEGTEMVIEFVKNRE
ncbi:ATP-binding protein [Rhodanobacter aciditrophus]|uniref:histidine kinase n=1 Tax=Rhodanobacter aciditrophus TaxID=1623218 RepID=A0ABW4B2N9_9GAMM